MVKSLYQISTINKDIIIQKRSSFKMTNYNKIFKVYIIKLIINRCTYLLHRWWWLHGSKLTFRIKSSSSHLAHCTYSAFWNAVWCSQITTVGTIFNVFGYDAGSGRDSNLPVNKRLRYSTDADYLLLFQSRKLVFILNFSGKINNSFLKRHWIKINFQKKNMYFLPIIWFSKGY